MNGAEPDVPADRGTARPRDAGGDPQRAARRVHPDGGQSTTGTAQNDKFVGRVSGVDETAAGETGAEARAEAGERQ